MSSGPDTSSSGPTGPGRFTRVFEWIVAVLCALVAAFVYLAIDPTPSRWFVFSPFLLVAAVAGGYALRLIWRGRRMGGAS